MRGSTDGPGLFRLYARGSARCRTSRFFRAASASGDVSSSQLSRSSSATSGSGIGSEAAGSSARTSGSGVRDGTSAGRGSIAGVGVGTRAGAGSGAGSGSGAENGWDSGLTTEEDSITDSALTRDLDSVGVAGRIAMGGTDGFGGAVFFDAKVVFMAGATAGRARITGFGGIGFETTTSRPATAVGTPSPNRSEERRVGEEGRCRWGRERGGRKKGGGIL